MDPLSDVLSIVKVKSYVSGGFVGGGAWAVDCPEHDGIKCYVVVRGECLVALDRIAEPVRLSAGDCLMLPDGRPFRLGTDLTAKAIDVRTIGTLERGDNGVRRVGPGEGTLVIGGHFVPEANADLLISVLPPIVHLKSESDKAALRGAVEQLTNEMREPRPGGELVARQAAYTMLVLALRLSLADGEKGGANWLYALADAQIAKAITAIHDAPAEAWTVQSLAERAGMSRTAFAEKFRRLVGAAPLEYLTRWRMLRAADRLRSTNDSIAEVAQAVGYESESAFGAAFKRTMGRSPREHARERS